MEDDYGQQPNAVNFDFKAFIYRTLSYWKWFLLALVIGVYVVYQQNIREEFPYTLDASLMIQDDKNPLFTSNTSLIFNYGGVSGKVQDVLLNLKSRKHHEKVVDSLNLYLTYLKSGRFRKTDIYKAAPFEFIGDQDAFQVIGHPIQITFVDDTHFELSYDFGEVESVNLQNYTTKAIKNVPVQTLSMSKTYKVGDYINLDVIKGSIVTKDSAKSLQGKTFFIEHVSFNRVVSQFVKNFRVIHENNSSLLELRLTHSNKAKIVDYLNTSIFILDRELLQRKNQYAINTVKFIDKQLARVKAELGKKADSLNRFKQQNKIFNINSESALLVRKIEDYAGKSLSQATPSTPVTIIGLSGVPQSNDVFQAKKEKIDKKGNNDNSD